MIDKVKSGFINAALKLMSLDDKIVMMYLETMPKNVRPIVILPAVKSTIKLILSKLQNQTKHGYVYNGNLNGVDVSVIQTRIGAPNTANIMESLSRCGCKVAIRIDFCGGLKEKGLNMGDIIVPKKVFLTDGTSLLYIQNYHKKLLNNPHFKGHSLVHKDSDSDKNDCLDYLIYPNYLEQYWSIKGNEELYKLIMNKDFGKVKSIPKEGILWSQDAIFCEEQNAVNTWNAYDCNSVDMESCAIYLLGAIYNIPVASILDVSDQPDANEYGLLKDKRIHPKVFPGLKNAIDYLVEKLPKIKEKFIN